MDKNEFKNAVIGLTEKQADALDGILFVRVENEDGQSFAGTMEYNPNRLGVDVVNGKITKAHGFS